MNQYQCQLFFKDAKPIAMLLLSLVVMLSGIESIIIRDRGSVD
jgi:hypothetical protein